ncbi:MAG: STN domain-containing protein, partial [Marinifilaceae bacterium]|nr:STN domain-containing protein [Marinifilaceae bacterium]
MSKKRKWNMLGHIRNLLLLLLFSTSVFGANNCYSQTQLFSVKSGSIESIFQQIREQSSYEFFYNTEVLNVKEHVELSMSQGTLDDVLREVLGEKYSYRIQDNYILISKNSAKQAQMVKDIVIRGVVKDT